MALALLFYEDDNCEDGSTPQKMELQRRLDVKIVTGGITNALFYISGFAPDLEYDA